MKQIRMILIVLIVIATFFAVAMYLFSKYESGSEQIINQKQEEQLNPTLIEMYPDEVKFVTDYFSELKEQNYEVLVKSYWQPMVVAEIRNECSSPLGDDPATTTESLWLNCERLDDVTVEIISIEQNESMSIVTVQFFDAGGAIIGLELHPEWVRGHQIMLHQTLSGFRTSDWNFLT